MRRALPEEHGKGFPGAQGKLGEKPPPVPEGRPQDLGECENEMPVGDGADHLLADELCPQGGALGGAGGAETPLLAGEGNEIFYDRNEWRSYRRDRGNQHHKRLPGSEVGNLINSHAQLPRA
jgi:hypothetical protein